MAALRCSRRFLKSKNRQRRNVNNERKLEPKPGWCERAYQFILGARGPGVNWLELVNEYEAAQKRADKPRTYTAAQAEKICRDRPGELVATPLGGGGYRYAGSTFQWWSDQKERWITSTFGDNLPPGFYTIHAAEPEPASKVLAHELDEDTGVCVHCDEFAPSGRCLWRQPRPNAPRPPTDAGEREELPKRITAVTDPLARVWNDVDGDTRVKLLHLFAQRMLAECCRIADERIEAATVERLTPNFDDGSHAWKKRDDFQLKPGARER